MVKVLFSGTVASADWDVFFQRVGEVQFSAHGPFDVLFLVGNRFETVDQFKVIEERLHALSPLTIYLFQCSVEVSALEDTSKNVRFLGPGKVGLINADKNLTICYATDMSDITYQSDIESVKKLVSTMGYRGCDALLTTSWPRESHQFLEGADLEDFKSSEIGIGAGARWVAEVAMLTRPRYHFVSDAGKFYQRVPYKNSATAMGQPAVFTRLISLHSASTSKDKQLKWLHALSFQPIIYLKPAEIEEAPALFTSCPFAPIGGGRSAPSALDGPPTKRSKGDFAANFHEGSSNSGSFFFGGAGGRGGGGGGSAPPSADSVTLFIGGLPREMRDRDLMDVIPDAVNVRRPPGKGFAFVDFTTHGAARAVLEHATNQGLSVLGRRLNVGWASASDRKEGGDEALFSTLMRERVLVPPTEDSKILYVGNLAGHGSDQQEEVRQELSKLFPKVASVSFPSNKAFAFLEFEAYADAMEALSLTLSQQQHVKGRPIVVGWSKQAGGKNAVIVYPPHPDCKVLFLGHIHPAATDGDIKDLWSDVRVYCIRRPQGRDYAFVEFGNPADAQRAMESACGADVIINEQPVSIGWAKGKPAAAADESKECWFCLASPMLKAHLVISVGQHNYLAMPRGAINDRHVLICPIDCVPSRVHLSLDAKSELLRFVECLEKFYATEDSSLLLFERAIRTRSGRDHMQVQCIPIPLSKVATVEDIFKKKADQNKLKFHELQADQAVDDAVMTMEGGPYQEYFYIELIGNTGKKSFVYVHEDASSGFPMQFGNEVSTSILGCPERVHWKHCLLSESQEEHQVSTFRDSFTQFDFTLA